MRPVLGITCCSRQIGSEAGQAVMERYLASAMRHADAAALLVPALPDLMSAREVAPRLDGLLLTGSPSNIGAERYLASAAGSGAGPFDPGRDGMALALIDSLLGLGRPVFGICRGLQEINVAFGGTLRGDLGEAGHHAADDVGLRGMFEHRHDVLLAEGGVLREALGRDRLQVNSVHYQGVDRLGAGLRVEATAVDGVVEGVSTQVNGAPVLAVQWHPEWRSDASSDAQTYFRLLGRALRGATLTEGAAA